VEKKILVKNLMFFRDIHSFGIHHTVGLSVSCSFLRPLSLISGFHLSLYWVNTTFHQDQSFYGYSILIIQRTDESETLTIHLLTLAFSSQLVVPSQIGLLFIYLQHCGGQVL